MLELLDNYKPDLIGMQEALYFQIKDLEEKLLDFRWIGLGRNGGSKSEFMAVFYRNHRLEPLEFDHFWLSDYPEIIGSTTWGNSNRRMVTWIRFLDKLTNREFYFVNTHFDHRIEFARIQSAKLLLNRMQEFKNNVPIVLGGDFNADAENSEPYSILVKNGSFSDTWHLAKKKKGIDLNTFNGFKPGPHKGGRRIDWILSKGNVQVDYSEIISFMRKDQYPSDHFPVFIDILFDTKQAEIFFQAHRGSVDEAPENTLSAIRHAWKIPGAVPEIDLRVSKDKEIICIHDETLARTTNAPASIKDIKVSELKYEEIKKWDAGIKFHKRFEGETVPTLDDVFNEMVQYSKNEIYLDIKDDSNLEKIKSLIVTHKLQSRVIFVHASQLKLKKFRAWFPEIRTMTWISGKTVEIKNNFEKLAETGFEGITQLQFHLRVDSSQSDITYLLEPEYITYALKKLESYQVELQLRPFEFNSSSLSKLKELGVKWFVTDAPLKFYNELEQN
jgi:glycerophosphoryl diester phosphodiesterase/exonuclease III